MDYLYKLPTELWIHVLNYIKIKSSKIHHVSELNMRYQILELRTVCKLFKHINPLNSYVESEIYKKETLIEFIDSNVDTVDWYDIILNNGWILRVDKYKQHYDICRIWNEFKHNEDTCIQLTRIFYPFFGREIQLSHDDSVMFLDNDTFDTYIHNLDHDLDINMWRRLFQYRYLYHAHEDMVIFYERYKQQLYNNITTISELSLYFKTSYIDLTLSHPVYIQMISKETLEQGDINILNNLMFYLNSEKIRHEFINSGLIQKHNLWHIVFKNVR